MKKIIIISSLIVLTLMADEQLGGTHHAFIRLKCEEKQEFLGNSSSSFLWAHEGSILFFLVTALLLSDIVRTALLHWKVLHRQVLLNSSCLEESALLMQDCTPPSPPPFAVMPVANAFQLCFPLIIISFYGMEFTTLWLQCQNCDFLFLQPHGHWWISLLVSHLCYQYILKP